MYGCNLKNLKVAAKGEGFRPIAETITSFATGVVDFMSIGHKLNNPRGVTGTVAFVRNANSQSVLALG